jgi:hypothetical protein
VLVATLRCWRERALRLAVPRAVLRAGGVADGCTTTGSSVWLGFPDCAQPSAGKRRQENAIELRNARWCRGGRIVREVINITRDNVARHRERSLAAASRRRRLNTHQDTPPNVLACDHD